MSSEDVRALDALIARARDGDRKATAELLLRYRGHVHATHARVIGPTSDGADLMQETFTRALVSLPKLRDVRGFSNWLRRIATNVAIDYVRRRKQQGWLSVVAPEALPEVEADAVDAAHRERVRRIYELLNELPLDDRLAFSLRWLADMELTQVAEHCGCSLATVKRRIKRGHAAFTELAQRDPVLSEQLTEPEGGA